MGAKGENISKIDVLKGVVSRPMRQIFTWKGTSPPIFFARIVRLMNALQLCR